VGGIIQD
jgi:hypothetical protein